MKRGIGVLVVLLIVIICVVTCPGHDAHSEALQDEMSNLIDDSMAYGASDNEVVGLSLLSLAMDTGIGGFIVDRLLDVHNYLLFSVGTITYENETKVVSIGLLNQVFVIRG